MSAAGSLACGGHAARESCGSERLARRALRRFSSKRVPARRLARNAPTNLATPSVSLLVQIAGMSILALFFSSATLAGATVTATSAYGRILCTGFLRFFGKYSYSIYVFHLPIESCLRARYPGRVFWGMREYPLAAELVHLLFASTIAVGVALLTWNLWEKHFLKLKKRWAS